MPTHRDVPWERDARAAARRGDSGGDPGVFHPPSVRPARPAGPVATAAGLGNEKPWVRWAIVPLVVLTVGLKASGALDDGEPSVAPLPGVVQPAAVAPAPAPAPAPAAVVPRTATTLSGLQSRMVGSGAIDVWGQTSAVDGTTVQLAVRARAGSRAERVVVPSAGGRFYARVALPPALRRRALQVRAQIDP